MHPALSVIVFTTASGAGYGLLALLGVVAAIGALPADRGFGAASLGLALALVSAGLLASTAHLGHPERAWRAFSQWRSSWLSREGVAAVATYVPALAFAAGWVFSGETGGWVAAAGGLAALGAVATVVCTAMIYASLKPIAEWHTGWTVAAYLAMALMSGAALLVALCFGFGHASPPLVALLFIAIAATWALKLVIWRRNAAAAMPTTLNSATGLEGGTVRSIEWPHTEENYLLKEMGYRIARKHAAKLRRIAQGLAFAAPLALTAVALAAGDGALATLAAVLAALAMAPGLLIERWLFFAEARHTVRLYYGR